MKTSIFYLCKKRNIFPKHDPLFYLPLQCRKKIFGKFCRNDYVCKNEYMDYNKFFTFQRCYIDVLSSRSDKVGTVTLIATKKNIFYKEGERVNIGIFNNYQHGRMFSVSPVRDFMDYFGAGNDFLDFLFDLWEKNKPTVMRYE